ncbi:flagellar brake domain-containing protein [Terribacillus sp. 179-K 1B1 HS]|uniref:flagellar brake protein n=1 Tax=Terribacillus sp. 179-K 1B1 HS TaxID=3142388 RepID=UPI0039A363A4
MLKIGSTLLLEITDVSNSEKWLRYRSKVIDLTDDEIYIGYPINEKTKRTDIFPVGTVFKALYVTEDDNAYTFVTTIKGKEMLKVPALMLSMPKEGEIRKIQRRQYVRISACTDVALYSEEREINPVSSITLDISGGGLSMLLPENHGFQEKMKVKLYIAYTLQKDGPAFLTAPGHIVRIARNEKSGKILASIQFDNIQERDRQAIIRFCFERQREQRKKDSR